MGILNFADTAAMHNFFIATARSLDLKAAVHKRLGFRRSHTCTNRRHYINESEGACFEACSGCRKPLCARCFRMTRPSRNLCNSCWQDQVAVNRKEVKAAEEKLQAGKFTVSRDFVNQHYHSGSHASSSSSPPPPLPPATVGGASSQRGKRYSSNSMGDGPSPLPPPPPAAAAATALSPAGPKAMSSQGGAPFVGRRRRSRGVKRKRNNKPAGPPPYPKHLWYSRYFSSDIYAPAKIQVTPSLLLCTLFPIWAHCLVNPLIKRNVEERKVFGPGSWQVGWGEFQWMLIAAGAKHPRWTKDISYIDAALKRSIDVADRSPCGITRSTFLATGKVLGLALFQRPRTATTSDGSCSSEDDEYIGSSEDDTYIDGDRISVHARCCARQACV